MGAYTTEDESQVCAYANRMSVMLTRTPVQSLIPSWARRNSRTRVRDFLMIYKRIINHET
jgi:hypothetical protein